MSVTYIKGKDNVITDCLSRAPVTSDSVKLPILQVHYTTTTLNCTPDRMQQLCESTQKDDTLTLLKEIIIQGWPASIKELPPDLHPYWTFCESITVADGLLQKGNRIIIPECERKQILDQIHCGYLGIQKCLQLTKCTVFWQKLYAELKDLISNCKICLKYSAANWKDSKQIGPQLGHEVPAQPWQNLATDLFTFDGHNYLLIVDYMSYFPIICKLKDLTARHVTEHIKAIFSELGIPASIVSDNGPCYASEYFQNAMKNLGVMHITTSPHHHQSNGLAEGYVCIIKSLLAKAKETGNDPQVVMTIYRTTPPCLSHCYYPLSCYMEGNHQMTSQCILQLTLPSLRIYVLRINTTLSQNRFFLLVLMWCTSHHQPNSGNQQWLLSTLVIDPTGYKLRIEEHTSVPPEFTSNPGKGTKV